MQSIKPNSSQNYIAFFLTLSCNLRCPYCINLHRSSNRGKQARREHLSAEEWIKAANRLVLRDDLPLTLQGGEPTLHKGFYRFVKEVDKRIKMDLLTNMSFDEDEFIKHVPVWRFTREAPYAAIRVSYHPGQNNIEELLKKTKKLQDAGFRIGLYSVLHPDPQKKQHIEEVKDRCQGQGIDFRFKEFLGEHNGELHGTFRYADSVLGASLKTCECKTTEIIVDPVGYVYRCHADLYNGRNHIAHILEENFTEASLDSFRECSFFGDCNPCDVKVKTNRMQIFGHTSVEIRNIGKENRAVR
ncbi:MAG: radical SAM protein [Candidatus Omnitrophica bacterium]|nr:radical SAM protein [Candidatus Omnitrophota bacterium]